MGPLSATGRLKSGDKIIAVAQGEEEAADILYWPLYKSVRLMRGEIGTQVVLDVIPASDPTGTEVVRIDLIRDEIKLEDRAAQSAIETIPQGEGKESFKVGVIVLPDFYADMKGKRLGAEDVRSSANDVRKLLLDLKEQEVDGVILDLRDNGGGSLPDAIEMAGLFIEDGPIVQVKANRRVKVMYDPDPSVIYDGPLVILINRHSASASEILAAALQDYKRAILVGDSKTHGKGSVQTLFQLDRRNSELGSLKLTTAAFYRINGQSTQLKGVTPDIIIPSALDVMEVGEEYLPNVLEWSWVSSAQYEPEEDAVEGYIGRLRGHSETRRRGDDRFKQYGSVVDRLKKKLNQKEISLNIETRLQRSREDKKMEELQKKFEPKVDTSKKEDDDKPLVDFENDLVLREAAAILQDFVSLSENAVLGKARELEKQPAGL